MGGSLLETVLTIVFHAFGEKVDRAFLPGRQRKIAAAIALQSRSRGIALYFQSDSIALQGPFCSLWQQLDRLGNDVIAMEILCLVFGFCLEQRSERHPNGSVHKSLCESVLHRNHEHIV